MKKPRFCNGQMNGDTKNGGGSLAAIRAKCCRKVIKDIEKILDI